MSCGDTSTVTFSGNNAKYNGGAINAINFSCIFYGHSRVTFSRNHTETLGGAILFEDYVIDNYLSFGDNSTVLFTAEQSLE